MRKVILIAALAAFAAMTANAAQTTGTAALAPASSKPVTWVAICTDGQHLQYNHTIGVVGLLYLNGLQIARLNQTSYTINRVCGAVVGNDTSAFNPPVSQVCIDKPTSTIRLIWHDPYHPNVIKDLGPYCKVRITMP